MKNGYIPNCKTVKGNGENDFQDNPNQTEVSAKVLSLPENETMQIVTDLKYREWRCKESFGYVFIAKQ